MSARREWPSPAYRTRPTPPRRTPRRVTAERRAQKRRDSLIIFLAGLAVMLAAWALVVAIAAHDAVILGGMP